MGITLSENDRQFLLQVALGNGDGWFAHYVTPTTMAEAGTITRLPDYEGAIEVSREITLGDGTLTVVHVRPAGTELWSPLEFEAG